MPIAPALALSSNWRNLPAMKQQMQPDGRARLPLLRMWLAVMATLLMVLAPGPSAPGQTGHELQLLAGQATLVASRDRELVTRPDAAQQGQPLPSFAVLPPEASPPAPRAGHGIRLAERAADRASRPTPGFRARAPPLSRNS